MKTFLSFAFLFVFANSYSFDHGHDTLITDGSGEFFSYSVPYIKDCYLKVSKVSGAVTGAKKTLEVYSMCGVQDSSVVFEKNVQLKIGDNVELKEEIKTGSDGYLEIECYDGAIIRLGPNSSLIIDTEMCVSGYTVLKYNLGVMWMKVNRVLTQEEPHVLIQTLGSSIGVRGTEFSVDVAEGNEVLKVFEGKVEIMGTMNTGKVESQAKDLEQLTNDFQQGKITQEEYMRKMQEYTEAIREGVSESVKKVEVEAGMMVKTINGAVSAPESISSGNEWFNEGIFK